jgi:hypothetical protein
MMYAYDIILPVLGIIMMYADIAMYRVLNGKFGGYLSSWKKDLMKLR